MQRRLPMYGMSIIPYFGRQFNGIYHQLSRATALVLAKSIMARILATGEPGQSHAARPVVAPARCLSLSC